MLVLYEPITAAAGEISFSDSVEENSKLLDRALATPALRSDLEGFLKEGKDELALQKLAFLSQVLLFRSQPDQVRTARQPALSPFGTLPT